MAVFIGATTHRMIGRQLRAAQPIAHRHARRQHDGQQHRRPRNTRADAEAHEHTSANDGTQPHHHRPRQADDALELRLLPGLSRHALHRCENYRRPQAKGLAAIGDSFINWSCTFLCETCLYCSAFSAVAFFKPRPNPSRPTSFSSLPTTRATGRSAGMGIRGFARRTSTSCTTPAHGSPGFW